MSMFILKLIALLTMTIDHIGANLVHNEELYLILRSIGRISFPLFAFAIAEGYRHTSSLKKYLLRLGIGSLATEVVLVIFYFITKENYMINEDIFLTLFLGLLCITLLNNKKIYIKLLVLPILFVSHIIKVDYGVYGILIIIMFGMSKKLWVNTICFVLINLLFITLLPRITALDGTIFEFNKFHIIQWISLVSIIPIMFYNGQQGKKMKYFFYLYYPVHLGIIYLISFLISG